MGAKERARQLHRAGPGEDRFRQGAVGESGGAQAPHRPHAAAPHRLTRGNRADRGVPGIARGELNHRADHRRGWWRDDCVMPRTPRWGAATRSAAGEGRSWLQLKRMDPLTTALSPPGKDANLL